MRAKACDSLELMKRENVLLSWVFAVASMVSGIALILGLIALFQFLKYEIVNWVRLSFVAGGPLCYLFRRLSNEYSGINSDPLYRKYEEIRKSKRPYDNSEN
jgi:hypothetical protein